VAARDARERESQWFEQCVLQARARLNPDALELVSGHLSWSLEANVLQEERWLAGRPVKIVDGTCLSMPDTEANQALCHSHGQQPGCGFPMMKLVGLFSLGSGALLETVTGNLHIHESVLFRDCGQTQERGCAAG